MKHIESYEDFRSLHEAFTPGSSFTFEGQNAKLSKAADIVAKFVAKKSRMDLKKFPFPTMFKGIVGIRYYDNKSNAAITVKGTPGPGIVGSLHYTTDYVKPTADISVSSEDFPIMLLVNEFTKLITDKKYEKEVLTLTESQQTLLESQTKTLTPQEKKLVSNGLKTGTSAMQLSKELGIPYGRILNFRKNEYMEEDSNDPVAKVNEQTLEDKVKFLDETLEDIYDVSRALAAGAFNSMMISGRAGTGKTFNVEKALKDEGLEEGDDFIVVSGAVSVIMMFKKMFQYNNKVLVFDDCDAVFRDENGRNILKAALDTKAVRNISYLKKSALVYDPKDFEMNPEAEFNAQEQGLVPNQFQFTGRVIFISNLPKDKADPDGAIRSRSILIDVNPDDATLMERIKTLLPHLEPRDMPLADKEEIYEFMKKAKDVSMRTFVKAAGFKQAGLSNWERMAKRYL